MTSDRTVKLFWCLKKWWRKVNLSQRQSSMILRSHKNCYKVMVNGLHLHNAFLPEWTKFFTSLTLTHTHSDTHSDGCHARRFGCPSRANSGFIDTATCGQEEPCINLPTLRLIDGPLYLSHGRWIMFIRCVWLRHLCCNSLKYCTI